MPECADADGDGHTESTRRIGRIAVPFLVAGISNYGNISSKVRVNVKVSKNSLQVLLPSQR